MIIDCHCHISFSDLFPHAFLAGLADNISRSLPIRSEAQQRIILQLLKSKMSDDNCAVLLNEMDEAGIDQSILLIADFGHALGDDEMSIADIHGFYHRILKQYPDKFVVFGGIDPRRGRSGIDLIEKSIREFGFKGLKLYPPCGFELDDHRLFPYYQLCDRFKLAIMIHTGPSLPLFCYEKKYPASLVTVAKQFKNISFILGHGAVKHQETGYRLASTIDNVFLDVSSFQSELQSTELTAKLKPLFAEIPEKVLFGTDYPMFNFHARQQKWVNFFRQCDFIDAEKLQMFFYGNIKKILTT